MRGRARSTVPDVALLVGVAGRLVDETELRAMDMGEGRGRGRSSGRRTIDDSKASFGFKNLSAATINSVP